MAGDSRPGIYIHIPFCASKCSYCSFYSVPGRRQADEYLCALLREMHLRSPAWQGYAFASVYIGGGTPSVLPAEAIPRILSGLRQHFALSPDCEISCEANPDSFSSEHALAWAEAGVNRLSLGLQSADEQLLHTLGRRHNAAQFLYAAEHALSAGIGNINGDMIFGIPGQSIAMLDATLALLERAKASHISCYGLQLEPGTTLYTQVQSGTLLLPTEDETGNMYEHINTALPALGYARYEISNFARPGRECRHNLNYWANGQYLALGASAAGAQRVTTNGNTTMLRYTNPADISAYITGITTGRLAEMQPIPRREEMFESVMLATRTLAGLDMPAFARRYGLGFLQAFQGAAKRCLADGLAEIENGRFRLSERGLDMQNSVLLLFMD